MINNNLIFYLFLKIFILLSSSSSSFIIDVNSINVTDITNNISNNQYGDPNCLLLFTVLIESDSLLKYDSMIYDSASYPLTLYFSSLDSNKNGILQYQLDTTNVLSGPSILNITFLFGNVSTIKEITKTFQFYCEKPNPIKLIEISKFTFLNKFYLISYLKINDFQSKINLPKLKITSNAIGFSILYIIPNPDGNFYKIIAVVNKQFDLSANNIIKLSFLNWLDIESTSSSIPGPFINYPILQVSKFVSTFYPNTTSFISNSANLISYNIYEFETNYQIPMLSNSDNIIYLSSVLISGNMNGSSGTGVVNNIWLTPFNIEKSNMYTVSVWDGSAFNFGSTFNYVSKKFVQPFINYAFLNGLGSNNADSQNAAITISETMANTAFTGQLSVPIAFYIFSNPNNHSIENRVYKNEFYQPYPYGVDTSIVGTYKFRLSLLLSKHTRTGAVVSSVLGSTLSQNPATSTIDSTPPKITLFRITHLGNGYFTIYAIIEDDSSGFQELTFGDLELLSPSDYDSGYIYTTSSYSRVMRPPIQSIALDSVIKAYDQAGNFAELPPFIGTYTTPTIRAPKQLNNIPTNNPFTITKFYFENPVMYVEEQGSWNSAYLNFSEVNEQQLFLNYPYFVIQPLQLCDNVNFRKEIPFEWNDDLQIYQANFFIPSNFPNGVIDWMISTPLIGNYFTSEYIQLITNYNPNSKLSFTSNTFQIKPPIIKEIIVETPTVSYSTSKRENASWIMTLEDDSDLLIGYISIASHVAQELNQTYAFNYRNLTITPNDALDPVTKKSYRLSIEIVCQNIFYDILNITLINQRGYVSQFLRSNKYDNSSSMTTTTTAIIDPLFKIMDQNLTIVSTCSLVEDVTPGYLEIHSLTSYALTIDSVSANRAIQMSLLVSDVKYGLHPSQNPFIYLFGGLYGKNLLSSPMQMVSFNGTHAYFSTTVTIPYGLGFLSPGRIFFEVFGVVNKFGKTRGWTITDLSNKNSPSIVRSISIVRTENCPYIESSSQYYNYSKVITIFGKNFNSPSTIVSFESDTSKFNTKIQIIDSNSIIINLEQPRNDKFYLTVSQSDTFLASNKFLVEPILFSTTKKPSTPTPTPTQTQTTTPLPTNPPQQCLGNPICGGPDKGMCTPSGCTCFSPNIGPSCGNKVIVIQPPVINPNNPSSNLTIDPSYSEEDDKTKSSLVGIISFLSLRELDFQSKVVKTHYFQKWEFTPPNNSDHGLNKNENLYKTNITTTTALNGESTTSITISTIWYEEKTNITFADQELIMNPSTLKYNINITSYDFESQLNTLQLVISAIATSNDANKDTCSNIEYGDTTNDNSNYIQLSVDNHSLYGRFIKRGIVDGKLTTIGNSKLNDLSLENSYYTSNSYIGINIPKYNNLVQLDPDFSILLSSKTTDGICKSNGGGISRNALIGIVVGCVGGALVVTISIILIIKYKYHLRNIKHVVKLNKISK